MARSTRLVVLIKNIYNLWGRKHFFLPVTYFPMNIVYPFILRVTGITTVDVEIKIEVQQVTYEIWHEIERK